MSGTCAMIETKEHFESRLSTLGRKHAAMAKGYITKTRRDGLIIVQPKRTRRARTARPIKGLVLLAAGVIAFKGLILAAVGPLEYNERLAKMAQGTQIEQGGAWVMQIDPATEFIAGLLGPLLG